MDIAAAVIGTAGATAITGVTTATDGGTAITGVTTATDGGIAMAGATRIGANATMAMRTIRIAVTTTTIPISGRIIGPTQRGRAIASAYVGGDCV